MTRHFAGSLLAALLVLLSLASHAHSFLLPSRLYGVRDLSEQAVTDLMTRYAVLGYYEGFTIIAGDDKTLEALKEKEGYPWTTLLDKEYDTNARYVVLEKQELLQDSKTAKVEWLNDVKAKLASRFPGIQILSSTYGRVFLKMSPVEMDRLIPLVSFDTDVNMLSRRPMTPVSRERTEILRTQRKNLKHRANIQDLVDQVNSEDLYDFATWLTGEQGSQMHTRNSYSVNTNNGVMDAAEYIHSKFTEYGFNTTYHNFRSDMGPNVIGILPGTVNPNKYVILGAHYDSRESNVNSQTNRAPGANDDGSGTSGLLEMAKLIHENGLTFGYSLILGAWCGEEQGLVGSGYYAEHCVDAGMDVIAMLQSDMIAYRVPSENPQCAFPNRYHTPDLTELVMDIVRTYVPDVEVCETSACCSDHMSFWEVGYAATQIFERCGSIADPQYHKSGDVVERSGYDVEGQFVYNVRANFAAALTIAEVN